MRIYITKQGDEWDRIAFEQLGLEHLMDQLIASNPEHKTTVVFSAGIKLVLPKIETRPQRSGPAPWRRVTRKSPLPNER